MNLGIQNANGGWSRFEDFCDRTERGSFLVYTNQCVLMEEELMFHELGQRVANSVIEYSVDGWDALVDKSYQVWCKRESFSDTQT